MGWPVPKTASLCGGRPFLGLSLALSAGWVMLAQTTTTGWLCALCSSQCGARSAAGVRVCACQTQLQPLTAASNGQPLSNVMCPAPAVALQLVTDSWSGTLIQAPSKPDKLDS